MRVRALEYPKELLSLTVLILLSLALMAGQAQAVGQSAPAAEESHILAIDIDVSFRHKGE